MCENHTTLRTARIKDIAERLFKAETTKQPIAPIHDEFPGLTLEEAYAVQMAAAENKLASGWKVVGKKVGLTNKEVQKQRGILEPDYGHIFDHNIIPEGDPISIASLMVHPVIEVELAFVMRRDLIGPGVTVAKAYHAVEGILPAFEIVERRMYPLSKTIEESVCDNAACGKIVLGSKLTPIENLNLKSIGVYLEKNGSLIDSACCATVLGTPIMSVAWLANKLAQFGVGIYEGEVIMTGSICLMHPIAPGENYHAVFSDNIGDLMVSFAS